MSRLNKLQKFAELLSFPNVYENFDARDPKLTGTDGATIDLKGRWAEGHFGNSNPIVLELACGKGHYTIGLAQRFPDKNFIGVDIKGARIWKGARGALDLELNNAAFLRTRIEQISHFFAPEEVSEIWITFPDPFLRDSKVNRRLTCARFLDRYRQILAPQGFIHLKTDSPELYEFTLETLAEDKGSELLYQDDDIYSKPLPDEVLDIKTYYELMHLEAKKTIKYVKFRVN